MFGDSMPSYKFTYFDAEAAGERARYLFAIAKVAYEDVRYPATDGRAAFFTDQATGKFAANLGKLPILEVDGVQLAQSKAIERYLAKAFGLMGASPLEEGVIDGLCEHERDMKISFQKLDALSGDAKLDAQKKWFEVDLPSWLDKIESSLPDSGGPFLTGSKVSLADVAFYVTLREYLVKWSPFAEDKQGSVERACSKSPRITGAISAVGSLPEVVAWRERRPAAKL